MNLSNWEDYNKTIINSIQNFRPEIKNTGLLEILIDCIFTKNADVSFLGDLGEKLKDFFVSIDSKHPELDCFCSNFIGAAAIEEINQICEILIFCRKKNYNKFLNRIKLLFESFTRNEMTLGGKTLGNPINTNCHTRFLPQEKLWVARSKKVKQKIYTTKATDSSINSSLDSLICYHHNSDRVLDLKNELERKRKLFENINCNLIMHEIDNAIDKLMSEIVSINFGFRRITLSNLAAKYRSLFEAADVLIHPITQDTIESNHFLKQIIDKTDNFFFRNQGYPVFDHYGIIKGPENKAGFIVGERDASTYFIGYLHE